MSENRKFDYYENVTNNAIGNMSGLAAQRFNSLSAKLKRKAEIIGIEFREVDRFYPSSKACHACGHIHKGLKLKDRVYICPACGYRADRDYNASLNLRDAREYRTA